ncbi:MAG: hypothetical protein ACRC36_17850, partial [Lacrimispora sphenoides]
EMEEVITNLNNSVRDEQQQLYVNLKNTGRTAEEVGGLVQKNFTGSLLLLKNDGSEMAFEDFTFREARYSADAGYEYLSLDFTKGENAVE